MSWPRTGDLCHAHYTKFSFHYAVIVQLIFLNPKYIYQIFYYITYNKYYHVLPLHGLIYHNCSAFNISITFSLFTRYHLYTTIHVVTLTVPLDCIHTTVYTPPVHVVYIYPYLTPPPVNFDILTPLKWDLSSINILQNWLESHVDLHPQLTPLSGSLFIVAYLCLIVG